VHTWDVHGDGQIITFPLDRSSVARVPLPYPGRLATCIVKAQGTGARSEGCTQNKSALALNSSSLHNQPRDLLLLGYRRKYDALRERQGTTRVPSHLELVLRKIVLVEPFLKPVNSFLFQRARAARLFATVADLVFIAPAALPPPAEIKGALTFNDIPRGRLPAVFSTMGTSTSPTHGRAGADDERHEQEAVTGTPHIDEESH